MLSETVGAYWDRKYLIIEAHSRYSLRRSFDYGLTPSAQDDNELLYPHFVAEVSQGFLFDAGHLDLADR